MNGGEARSNGEHREEEEEDPAILAALAASREEEDPAVLAALEASRREAEEPRESRGPIMMFSTLGREQEEELEGEVEEEEAEEQAAVQAAIEASQQEVEDEPAAAEEPRREAKGPVMMFSTLGRSEAWVDEEAADEPEEPGDLDPDDEEEEPAAEDAGAEEEKKEKLNPTLRRAYITKVKPEKRYCSSDEDSDGTWGGARRKKKKAGPPGKAKAAPAAARAKAPAAGPSTVFQCPHCNLTFETIGQLNVHKHSVHGEARPSVLDLGEAVIAGLQEKAGAPKEKILKELLASYGSMVEDADRVGSLLGIALVEGIEFGRLRQGTSGKKNWNNYWLQENSKKRRLVQESWARDPATVGDLSTSGGKIADNLIENSGEFVAIKEKLDKHNIQITTAVKKPDEPKPKSKAKKSKFDDDDDIEIVSEKISQKTKLKIAQKKKVASTKPKAVIKVNSVQGKQMLKNIVKTGKVPASMAKTSPSKTSAALQTSAASFGDEEDEDEHLTCPTCFSAFWYPSQTYGHMSSVHNIENPEKYMKERKKSKR